MPNLLRSNDRRKIRTGLKVLHRHRVGGMVFRRVSEMVFVRGRPVALPEWINLGGVRTPLYVCELDMSKLRPAGNDKNTYYYDDLTVDPRFERPPEPGSSHGF
jgi:hypothetical protein